MNIETIYALRMNLMRLARLMDRRISTMILAALVIAALSPISSQAAPTIDEIQLKTVDGPLALSELKGKVIFLDFWASWCGPCRESFPWMNEMHEKYQNQGLVVIAVNVDNDSAEMTKFLQDFPANFIIALDPQGVLANQFDLLGMPSSYLIGRDGELRQQHIGFRKEKRQEYEHSLTTLIAELS